MNTQGFLTELAGIFPAERLLTERAELIPYESDALTAYSALPRAVVLPEY
jgi:glycolate oxidase